MPTDLARAMELARKLAPCADCKGRGYYVGECHPLEECCLCHGSGLDCRVTEKDLKILSLGLEAARSDEREACAAEKDAVREELKQLRADLADAERQLRLWSNGCAMNGVCAQAERFRELRERDG